MREKDVELVWTAEALLWGRQGIDGFVLPQTLYHRSQLRSLYRRTLPSTAHAPKSKSILRATTTCLAGLVVLWGNFVCRAFTGSRSLGHDALLRDAKSPEDFVHKTPTYVLSASIFPGAGSYLCYSYLTWPSTSKYLQEIMSLRT